MKPSDHRSITCTKGQFGVSMTSSRNITQTWEHGVRMKWRIESWLTFLCMQWKTYNAKEGVTLLRKKSAHGPADTSECRGWGGGVGVGVGGWGGGWGVGVGGWGWGGGGGGVGDRLKYVHTGRLVLIIGLASLTFLFNQNSISSNPYEIQPFNKIRTLPASNIFYFNSTH